MIHLFECNKKQKTIAEYFGNNCGINLKERLTKLIESNDIKISYQKSKSNKTYWKNLEHILLENESTNFVKCNSIIKYNRQLGQNV